MSQNPPPVAQPSGAKSPGSDVSPRTVILPNESQAGDYFSATAVADKETDPGVLSLSPAGAAKPGSPGGSATTAPSVVASTATDLAQSSRRSSKNDNDSDIPTIDSRKSSTASVTWQTTHPKLPQGDKRRTDAKRLRESSPSPIKFRTHVGFDNLPIGEATKNNTAAFTLNVRHQGYQPKRRSRTFMAGVDEHAYSDYALKWLLDSLVDDGDEVVCVRVIENPTRVGERSYQEDARRMLQRIQEKNEKNKAISLVLEYSVGKLHSTFQQLIQVYQPSMLIVGTRGRSLGGIQGLVNTRNSFSKYCLQYSPVPVVVVRPDEKRKKKKDKRNNDANRQTYAHLLAQNPLGKHEADSENSSIYALESGLSADEEAHRVAKAIGLPAAFDPTIKPYTPHPQMQARHSSPSVLTTATHPERPTGPRRRASSPPPAVGNESEPDDSGEDEDEFEVQSGAQILQREKQLQQEQKKRLHAMEVGEAAALLKSGAGKSLDEEEDEEDGS